MSFSSQLKIYLGEKIIEVLIWIGLIILSTLFFYNVMTRQETYWPDSMNYIDVSRNIAYGNGRSQSSLGFNQPLLFEEYSKIPSSYIMQAPLYPILISFLYHCGLTFHSAALLIPAISYMLVILFSSLILKIILPDQGGLLCIGVLLIYHPLRKNCAMPMSEGPALALMCSSFFLLIRARASVSPFREKILWMMAGITSGLAFDTKYAMAPLVFCGIIYIFIEFRLRIQYIYALLFYMAGAAMAIVPLLAHNFYISGLILPEFNPSDHSFGLCLKEALLSIVGDFINIPATKYRLIFILTLLIAYIIYVLVQKKIKPVWSVLKSTPYFHILIWWFLLYNVIISIERSIHHFDALTPRIMLPAALTLILICIIILVKLFRKITPKYLFYAYACILLYNETGWYLQISIGMFFIVAAICLIIIFIDISQKLVPAILLLSIIVAIMSEIRTSLYLPTESFEKNIMESERLSWVSANTSNKDLVVGDLTMDIPFYFPGHHSISFAEYPYSIPLTYTKLMSYLKLHNGYENIYLILRHETASKKDIYHFGQFISDIDSCHLQSYAGITLVKSLKDGIVFRVVKTPN
jgi:hypothetical protein